MSVPLGALIYLAGLFFAEALRLPRRLNRRRERQAWSKSGGPRYMPEVLVLSAILLGIWVFPIIYAFTGWLQRFDYSLPAWSIWPAALIFVLSLALRWRAHRDLGGQWSGTLETADGQRLVTGGIYAHIRHPLYASLVLLALAQPALLQNWLAGWGGPLAVALIWLVRVPREERMLLEKFGDEYRRYVARTGRLLPARQRETNRRTEE